VKEAGSLNLPAKIVKEMALGENPQTIDFSIPALYACPTT
jgi:hypothetical protein